MNESARLPCSLSIDSGAILAYYLGERIGAVVRTQLIDVTAGAYKCQRAISLAECYVIATAKHQQATALFPCHETDLDKEIKKKSFDVPILFLEDFAKWSRSRVPFPAGSICPDEPSCLRHAYAKMRGICPAPSVPLIYGSGRHRFFHGTHATRRIRERGYLK